MSLRKLCVFLYVNCIFIFRIANTFVASYAMKYSEIFFVIRKFLAYTPPTIHASYGPDVPKGSGASNPILVALEYLYVVIAFFLSLTLMACIIHALSDWVNSTKPPSKNDLKQSLSRIANSLSTRREEQPSINMALPRPFTTPLPPQALPRPYVGTT